MTNQNAPERVEASQISAGDSTPPALRTQAVEGFNDFQTVSDAMQTNNPAETTNLTITDAAGNNLTNNRDGAVMNATFTAPRSDGSTQLPNGDNQDPFEFKPNKDSNTPVIDPRQLLSPESLDKPIFDEATGKWLAPERPTIAPEAARPGTADQSAKAESSTPENFVNSQFDGVGNLQSVTSSIEGTTTTFEFGADRSVTRTTQSEKGTEVTRFGADGKPLSREVIGPDGTVTNNEIRPNDSVRLEMSANGKPARLVSEQNGNRTTMLFDRNGNVTGRNIQSNEPGNRFDSRTGFDNNGNVRDEMLTLMDDNGTVREMQHLTPNRSTIERFDANGRLTESMDESANGFRRTTKALSDGGTATATEFVDGGRSSTVTDKDGNLTYRHSEQPNGNSTTFMRNPDGSTLSTSDTRDSTSFMRENADGSWESTVLDKKWNKTTTMIGKSRDDPGIEVRDI